MTRIWSEPTSTCLPESWLNPSPLYGHSHALGMGTKALTDALTRNWPLNGKDHSRKTALDKTFCSIRKPVQNTEFPSYFSFS